MKRIIVGISGASGVNLGLNLLYEVAKKCEAHFIISQNAKLVLEQEQGLSFNKFKEQILSNSPTPLNIKFYNDSDISAPLASGSFDINAVIIAPCSINTLAKISCSISDTLITRAAAVALKQGRKLVLGVREMPFSAISLRQMSELSALGVIIAPPILGYYSKAQNLDDMQNFIIGKWLDTLEISHNLYKKWGD